MIAVTERTVVRDLSLRTVTFHARRFGGHNHIRGIGALRGVVAFRASDAEVLRVIEVRTNHPTVRRGRRRDRWRTD